MRIPFSFLKTLSLPLVLGTAAISFLVPSLPIKEIGKMDVALVATQSIKPSSPVTDLKPFKLSLLDQFTPTTYSPFVFFYSMNDAHLRKAAQLSSHLKWSLSKALTHYYPLSGRFEDNLFISNFEAGVPFTESRVKGRLSDLLQHPQLELLNELLPCEPFCHQLDPMAPQLAVQANIFDCGGMALGMCFLHKINDGATVSSFLKTWAANASGRFDKVVPPNLSEASLHFPPQESMPENYASMMNDLWFSEIKLATRRYVFDANAVATLRAKARSEVVGNPTRLQALGSFIWKSAMMASRSVLSTPKLSIFSQAVNLRRLIKPRLSQNVFGNLVSHAIATSDQPETEIADLVVLVRDSVARLNNEYLSTLSSEGSASIVKQINHLIEISEGKPEIFGFTSLNTFGFNDIDFGWGKPIWVGASGEASQNSPRDSNFAILNDYGKTGAMELWMTLDERVMALLEQDPEFLSFACSNPKILPPHDFNSVK